MLLVTRKLIDRSKVILVIGGAAWADHIAVNLYNNGAYPNLELYLPCRYDNCSYYDNGESHWSRNPGKISNYYHKLFSNKC